MKLGRFTPIPAQADENDVQATLTLWPGRWYVPIMRLLACLLGCLAATGAFADVTPANVASLTTRWETMAGGVTGGAILRDGRLYVGAWDGLVTALDPATGAKLWSTSVKGPVPGSVLALDDGGVCYGT